MVFAWVFCLLLQGLRVRQQLEGGVFVRKNDCGFAFTCLAAKRLMNLAVHEIVGQAVHELSS